jgi:beta-lactamase regulating signal transducer with metallopeptidase domain
MILSWMLYASLIALLLSLAAWALEGVVRQRGGPVRGVWTAALIVSLALPAVALVVRPVSESAAVASAPGLAAAPAPVAAATLVWTEWTEPLASAAAAVHRKRPDLDPWLLALWGAASVGIAVALTRSYFSLARRRRRWRRADVEGRSVWISEDTGPAVVGVFPGRVVVPEWLLDASDVERRIVLAHEEEHVRARDPVLLWSALLLWAAMPWNVGLWWIHRRIRRAVEVDCDRRVLTSGVDPKTYSRLLLDVGERGTAHRLAVAALSEHPSFLERRIRVILASKSRWWLGRACASAVLATGLVLGACEVDRPASSLVRKDSSLGEHKRAESLRAVNTGVTGVGISGESVTPVRTASAPDEIRSFDDAVRTALEEFYPHLLTEALPVVRVNLYFLASAQGEMVRSAFDTEERLGRCNASLEAGLGTAVDPKSIESSGCASLRAGRIGRNALQVFWASLKANGDAAGDPGPYRFHQITSAGQPSQAHLRAAVERYHPDVLREGLPRGEGVWFIADRDHRVLHTGRGAVTTDSGAVKRDLEARHPGVKIDRMLMGSVPGHTGDWSSLVWATLAEPGAGLDSGDVSGAGAPPTPRAQ